MRTEIPAPARRPIRYLPGRDLPAYRYVPGIHPHPLRDPAGHSFASPQARADRPAWAAVDWRSRQEWLWGIDLFNEFFFWEAHEAWEGLWSAQPRHSRPALLLQGLIQLAAALLKIHLGSAPGAHRLAGQGLDKLGSAAAGSAPVLGLRIPETMAAFRCYFRPLDRQILPPLDASVPTLTLVGVGPA